MDQIEKALYSELRTTRLELLESLIEEKCSPLIKPLIEAELYDIECTLKKMEKGDFGVCELSGEFLPTNILQNIPTIKTMNDCQKIENFFRKGFYE